MTYDQWKTTDPRDYEPEEEQLSELEEMDRAMFEMKQTAERNARIAEARIKKLEAALEEALEYFEDRYDVVDGSYGERQLELIPATPVTPMVLLERAIATGAGLDVIDKFMGLQERWEANQARKAFDEAIAGAKAEIPTITKNREVDFTSQKGRTHYRYEDLAEIAKVVSPILSKHGLSYRYRTTSNPNEPVTVTCILSHRAGHFEENTLSAGRDESGNKNSIQAVGSTITYLQRMTLKAALGLAVSNDDDGKDAGGTDAVSLEQVEELIALADEVRADKEAFCRYFKVDGFADIKAKDFDRAKSALNKKRSAK